MFVCLSVGLSMGTSSRMVQFTVGKVKKISITFSLLLYYIFELGRLRSRMITKIPESFIAVTQSQSRR